MPGGKAGKEPKMGKYEVFTEPHTGVHSIEIKEGITLYFAPKKLEDLSGWEMAKDGETIVYTDTWQNVSWAQIEQDLQRLRAKLDETVGQEEGKKIFEIITDKLKEEE